MRIFSSGLLDMTSQWHWQLELLVAAKDFARVRSRLLSFLEEVHKWIDISLVESERLVTVERHS